MIMMNDRVKSCLDNGWKILFYDLAEDASEIREEAIKKGYTKKDIKVYRVSNGHGLAYNRGLKSYVALVPDDGQSNEDRK